MIRNLRKAAITSAVIAFGTGVFYMIKPDSYTNEKVMAVVVDKDLDYRDMNKAGSYDEYEITFEYEDVETEIDSEKLYYSHELGEKVQVVLHTAYDKEGNVIHRELKAIPENY